MQFWEALQICHFLRTCATPEQVNRELTDFEKWCGGEGYARHSLAKIYKWLAPVCGEEKPSFIIKWERDLGRTLGNGTWQKVCAAAHKSSVACNIQEAGYKLLSRWYRTPRVLHRMFPSSSNRCWRCNGEEGTIYHIFWSCPVLERFWQTVWQTCQEVTGEQVPRDPGLYLLHITDTPWKTYRNSLLIHLVNAAQACIPANWKQKSPPSCYAWAQRVNHIGQMEELMANKLGRMGTFREIWENWHAFQRTERYRRLLGETTAEGPMG